MLYYCLRALRVNEKQQKEIRKFMIKISHRIKTFHFKCLVVHKEIKTQKMIQKMNAYKIRNLFMINKAFKSLKLHMR